MENKYYWDVLSERAKLIYDALIGICIGVLMIVVSALIWVFGSDIWGRQFMAGMGCYTAYYALGLVIELVISDEDDIRNGINRFKEKLGLL